MAIFYVRPLATGNDDGSDWDNAWVTIESALTKSDYTKGDKVYLHGIEYSNRDYYIAGAVNTMVEFVAVDETGTPNENSFYTIDGTAHTSSVFFTFSSGGAQRRILKNIVFQNFNHIFTYSNTSAGLPYFVKCYFILCGGNIIAGGAGAAYPAFYSCVFWLCGMIASGNVTYISLEDCIAYNISQLSNNTGSFTAFNCRFIKITTGIVPSSTGSVSLRNCLIEECANRAVFTFSNRGYYFNGCRFNRCGTGIYIAAGAEIYLQSCRFNQNTNDLEYHSYGYLNQLGVNQFGGNVEEFVDVANLDYRLIGGAKLRNDTVSWLSLPTPIPLVPLIRYHAGAHERDIIYPNIEQCNPSYGSTDGSNVTLTGIGLSGCTSLLFGSTPGSIVSSDYGFISGVAPALSAGRYDIFASGAAGIAAISGGFTAVAMDRKITSITKSVGDVNGYMVVRLYSEEGLFLNAQSVDFEGIPARSFEVIDANNIDAVLPKLDPSFYTVSVN